MVVSTIRDEIIVEVGADTSDTAVQTKVLQFMNSAMRKFPLWTRSLFMYTTKTATLSSGGSSLSLPSGVVGIRDVYYISDSNRLRIEKPPSNTYFNDATNTSTTGAPHFYNIVGQTVYFDRSADKAYTIYFECQQEKDGLVSGDTVTFDTTVVEVWKDGVKSYYYRYVEDDNQAKEFLQLFKNGLDELDSKYVASELGTHIDEE